MSLKPVSKFNVKNGPEHAFFLSLDSSVFAGLSKNPKSGEKFPQDRIARIWGFGRLQI
jgi:hypothetical protein